MNKFRTGEIPKKLPYEHLRGKLDGDSLLEDLGIEYSHRHGHWLMAHCPNWYGNHQNGDANPSFGLYPAGMKANCFVCGQMDVLDLVKLTLGVDEDEAMSFLEEHADLDPSTGTDITDRINKLRHPEEERNVMPEYDPDALFQYRFIHPYLYERGLTKEIIVEMQVGFDDEHCGIIIPHYFQGKLRGWQTRHLVEDPKGTYHCEVHSCNFKNEKPIKVPKYKNTPSLPKINTLYGYDRFKQKLTGDSVIIVESPMTALKLMSMGFDNVVATFGQWSKEQGMLLLPLKTLYFWPDNDGAGWANANKCILDQRRFNSVMIAPAVPGQKSDAANLTSAEEVKLYLDAAYPSSLFPLRSKEKLAEYEPLANV